MKFNAHTVGPFLSPAALSSPRAHFAWLAVVVGGSHFLFFCSSDPSSPSPASPPRISAHQPAHTVGS